MVTVFYELPNDPQPCLARSIQRKFGGGNSSRSSSSSSNYFYCMLVALQVQHTLGSSDYVRSDISLNFDCILIHSCPFHGVAQVQRTLGSSDYMRRDMTLIVLRFFFALMVVLHRSSGPWAGAKCTEIT